MPDPNDPYSGYNAMQAHLGVTPMAQPPSPGDAARMLVSQSAQQRVSAMSAGMPPSNWGGGGGGGASVFGAQFRQRFESIQSQQSFNPYIAQAMSGGQGYAPGMLPSPVMMTPPSTGVYRTRPQGPMFAPLPPQPMTPPIRTPFTPMPTSPMFQLPEDRAARMQDMEKDQFFSRAVQAPRVIGQGIGVGGAAALGGAIGGPLGAIAGGILGQTSGVAQGLGNLAMRPFQPMIERRQMGSALRRMSQDWVVSGQDTHSTGRGFNRDASIRLAEEIQDLSKDRSFKRDTGDMFNRSDLMKITQESGRSGLLDESQDIEGVRKNIKNVSRTLRKYMQLTQDPDMVNVLRELGQMKQLGMSLDDMEEAAQSMNRYSRAAGASIAGIKQMGMAGAATFQQAGLSGGSGMTYGMHSAAAARQAVATGTFQPRELALLGGVQGVAQRNMQAQAAMLSMPLFGAAAGQYGAGGFGLNQGALGGMGAGGGAGMVRQAVSNMGNAVQQGGVGALALFPLQQRRLQTEAAENMTPEQLTAMRFQMSLQTGRQLRLQGAGAFGAGSRMLFGNEVAEQMKVEAQNPQFWQAQRNRINEQQQRLARRQRQQAEERVPGSMTRIGRDLSRGLGFDKMSKGFGMIGRAYGAGFENVGRTFGAIGDALEDVDAEAEGRVITRMDERLVASSRERRQARGVDRGVLSAAGLQGPRRTVTGGPSDRLVSRALDYSGAFDTSEAASAGLAAGSVMMPGAAILTNVLGLENVPRAGLESAMGSGASLMLGEERTARLLVNAQVNKARAFSRAATYASGKGATVAGRTSAYEALDKASKNRVDSGAAASRAAGKVANLVKNRQQGGLASIFLDDGTINPDELDKVIRTSLAEEGLPASEVEATIKRMKASGDYEKFQGAVFSKAKNIAGPEYEAQFDAAETEAGLLTKTAERDAQEEIMEGKKATLTALENQLDFTANIGLVEGEGGVREMLSEGPSAMLAKTVAASQGTKGAAAARKAALAEFMRINKGSGKSEAQLRKEFNKKVEEAEISLSGVSDEAKERLRGIAAGGETGDVSKSMRMLTTLSAESIKSQQYADVVGGGGLQTIREAIGGEGADRLGELLSTGEVTGGEVAKRMSKRDLRQLARSGHKGLARKMAQFQKETDPEKRAQLESEVMDSLASLGEARKKKEEETLKAEGKEAEDLEKSDEALAGVQGEMAQAFKDFRPAVEKFADGAERLQKAMESDMFKRMTEGD